MEITFYVIIQYDIMLLQCHIELVCTHTALIYRTCYRNNKSMPVKMQLHLHYNSLCTD